MHLHIQPWAFDSALREEEEAKKRIFASKIRFALKRQVIHPYNAKEKENPNLTYTKI